MPPPISVIIPTYQRKDIAVHTLRSFDRGGVRAEIVVVVDGSADGTAEALRNTSSIHEVVVIEQPNRGAAAARNTGAAAASSSLLLFVDDDMSADDHVLDAHISAHDSHDDSSLVLQGRMDFDPASPSTIIADLVRDWSADHHAIHTAEPKITSGLDFLTGHFSIRKEFFDELGGLSQNYNAGGRYGNEDLDLGQRIIAAGGRIRYLPEARTFQRYAVSCEAYFRQAYDLGMTDAIFQSTSAEARELVLQRRAQWSTIDNRYWRALANRSLGLATLAARPGRRRAIQAVDRGERDRRTEQRFYLHKSLAYRAGARSDAPTSFRSSEA